MQIEDNKKNKKFKLRKHLTATLILNQIYIELTEKDILLETFSDSLSIQLTDFSLDAVMKLTVEDLIKITEYFGKLLHISFETNSTKEKEKRIKEALMKTMENAYIQK